MATEQDHSLLRGVPDYMGLNEFASIQRKSQHLCKVGGKTQWQGNSLYIAKAACARGTIPGLLTGDTGRLYKKFLVRLFKKKCTFYILPIFLDNYLSVFFTF